MTPAALAAAGSIVAFLLTYAARALWNSWQSEQEPTEPTEEDSDYE